MERKHCNKQGNDLSNAATFYRLARV